MRSMAPAQKTTVPFSPVVASAFELPTAVEAAAVIEPWVEPAGTIVAAWVPTPAVAIPVLPPGTSPPPAGGFTVGGFTTGGFTTGGVTTGGFTTGGVTTGGFTTGGVTTGGVTVPTDPPPTPTEVEPTLTGAVIGTITWVPEKSPSLPEVVLPPVVPAGALPPLVPVFVADESPNTPAEVEPTFTGAVIGATT